LLVNRATAELPADFCYGRFLSVPNLLLTFPA
jgi:hypothetical protein